MVKTNDDVNDADRLGRDPAMRWIVGGKAIERQAASTSQMGRFETLLATDENVEALVDMNGVWIDKVHDRHPPKMARSRGVTSAVPASIRYSKQFGDGHRVPTAQLEYEYLEAEGLLYGLKKFSSYAMSVTVRRFHASFTIVEQEAPCLDGTRSSRARRDKCRSQALLATFSPPSP